MIYSMWCLLTNPTPHSRTIMFAGTLAAEASMMAGRHFSKIFDPWKWTAVDWRFSNKVEEWIFCERSECRFPIRSKLVRPECSCYKRKCERQKWSSLLTRDTQRWFEREVDPTLCKGDLAFFFKCITTLENLRLWAHKCASWYPTKCGWFGNTWIFRRFWSDCRGPTLDSIRSGMFHGYGRGWSRLRSSDRIRKLNKDRHDMLSIPNYVIKKGPSHGARHGGTQRGKESITQLT